MNEMKRLEVDPEAAASAAPEPAPRARWRRWAIMLIVPVLLAIGGIWLWATSGRTVSTDNAQIGAHVVSVAPEVGGRITQVFVRENQEVKAGDPLFRIDPAPYRIALMQADAAVAEARVQINQLQSNLVSRQADIGSNAAEVSLAAENFRRQQELLARGFTTRASFDAARAALATARAKRDVAAADAASAQAVLGSGGSGAGYPQVEAALAQRAKAALDLQRTEVHASIAGRVAQTDRLEPGATAVASLPMVSLVDAQGLWIEANFKETQLARMRVGQHATVRIDAVPGKRFDAVVTGIGAGTGSQFSVLPAQNATGNWVKVEQRVPVRLRFTAPPSQPLVAGWSAKVAVDIAGG